MELTACSYEPGAVSADDEELALEIEGVEGISGEPTARWPPSRVTLDEAKYWLSGPPPDE